MFPTVDLWECGGYRRSFTPLPIKHIKTIKYLKTHKLINKSAKKNKGIKLRTVVKPMHKGGKQG